MNIIAKSLLNAIWGIAGLISVALLLWLTYSFGRVALETPSPRVTIDSPTMLSGNPDHRQVDKARDILSDGLNKQIDRAIAQITLIGSIFGLALAAILVLMWFNYAERVREAASLLDQIKKEPERISREYLKSQLDIQLREIFSPDAVRRGAALRGLLNNSELKQQHFDLLDVALKEEFDRPSNANLTRNSELIVEMMAGLKPLETASAIWTLLHKVDPRRANLGHLTRMLLGLGPDIFKSAIEELLVTKDIPLRNIVFLEMLRGPLIEIEMACYILEKCDDWIVEQLLGMWLPSNAAISDDLIFESLIRRPKMPFGVCFAFLNPFLDGKLKNRMSRPQKIALILRCVDSLRDRATGGKIEQEFASGQLGNIVIRAHETDIRFDELNELWTRCSKDALLMEILRSSMVVRLQALGSEFGKSMHDFLEREQG